MTIEQINDFAFPQGWGVVFKSNHERCASTNKFELIAMGTPFRFDDEASAFVVRMAKDDKDSVYAEAIRFLAKESPNELYAIISSNHLINSAEFDQCLKVVGIN